MGTADFSEPARRRRNKAHARRVVPSGPWLAVGGGVAAAVILVVSLLTFTGKSSPPRTAGANPAAQAPANQAPLAPPTTVAAPVQLVQSDNQGAIFSLSTTASIELVSTQRCWVEVRSGSATGAVVYSGTMVGGQRQSLPSGQTLWIRLGYPPGVSVVINGTPLAAAVLSTPSPYNLKFQTTTG
jgi:cytoskeleton protein RodZ